MLLAQVLEVVAFHDLDAAVAGGEGVAVLGDPGRGDDDAFRGALVFHGAGQGAHHVDADRLARALGLDDAQSAEDWRLAHRDSVDSVILDVLSLPRLHAHSLKELLDEGLEFEGGQGEQVGAAVQADDDVAPATNLNWASSESKLTRGRTGSRS